MPRIESSVLFPAPDGPMMLTNSPSLMSSVIWRSNQVRVGPVSMDFSMFRRLIMEAT